MKEKVPASGLFISLTKSVVHNGAYVGRLPKATRLFHRFFLTCGLAESAARTQAETRRIRMLRAALPVASGHTMA